jgi:Cu/Ag efflux protein CusF
MKTLQHIGLAALIGLGSSLSVIAQDGALSEGEIRKIDRDNKKITLKHGEIKNLDMPGMTMVFQLREAAMADQLKVGDKVRFRAEKSASGFMVTELLPAAQ